MLLLFCKSLAVPQKVKYSYHLTQQFHSQRFTQNDNICPQKDLRTESSTIFIIVKKWNHPNIFQWWKDKFHWYIQSMESYLAIKRDEVLIHPIMWVNLENILRERSQPKKIVCYIIPFISKVHNTQIYRG